MCDQSQSSEQYKLVKANLIISKTTIAHRCRPRKNVSYCAYCAEEGTKKARKKQELELFLMAV